MTDPVELRLTPGQSVTISVTAEEPPPPQPQAGPLFGLMAPVGAQWQRAAAEYPGIAYTREFGKDADGDKLPDLAPIGAAGTKWPYMPAGATAHVSWKDDVHQLPRWLDALDRPVLLTWYHEPMGDVTPTAYRATAARVTDYVASHVNGRFVMGHGPIITRYWMEEGKGNPADWAYPGMTHFGVDCYSQDRAAYWPAERMFACLDRVAALFPEVRLLVPELGIVQTTTDKSDEGRAATLREYAQHLRRRGDVDAVGYFHSDAYPQYKLSGASADAWRWVLAHQ